MISMKVRASVKRICDKCKIVRRRGVVFVLCEILGINNDKASRTVEFALVWRIE